MRCSEAIDVKNKSSAGARLYARAQDRTCTPTRNMRVFIVATIIKPIGEDENLPWKGKKLSPIKTPTIYALCLPARNCKTLFSTNFLFALLFKLILSNTIVRRKLTLSRLNVSWTM